MIQLPPISTRTDTLFPDTTLVLSAAALPLFAAADERAGRLQREALEPETLLAPMGEGAEVVEDYRASGLSLRAHPLAFLRSEEHTSELQSLMRISYAVFCLKKKKKQTKQNNLTTSTDQDDMK